MREPIPTTPASAQIEPLSERALAAGLGLACAEGDEEWIRGLISASPYAGGIPSDILSELIDLILGRSTTKAQAREQGEPSAGKTLK